MAPLPYVTDSRFYNLNTVNGLHSLIKQRYVFYRGVASKYTNRYNALFATTYRSAYNIAKRLIETALTVKATNYYHSNNDIKSLELLVL